MRRRRRPRLLDLCCGAGAASKGYHDAGFDVVGVDVNPQPNYPYRLHTRDAIEFLDLCADCGDPYFDPCELHRLFNHSGGVHGHEFVRVVDHFDVIHASPPCQRWAAITVKGRKSHPDLITPLRERLAGSGLVYVIENVVKAPLIDPVMLCGGAFGCVSGHLQLHRHRNFESNVPLTGTGCVTVRPNTVSVVGHGSPSGNRGTLGRNPTIREKREAMGVDWTTRDELSEAIPPAYTEFIGRQLLEYLSM